MGNMEYNMKNEMKLSERQVVRNGMDWEQVTLTVPKWK